MTFYRVIDSFCCVDGFAVVKTSVQEYSSVKQTPCGHWIVAANAIFPGGHVFGKKRWVSLTGRKRFAYPTVSLALESWRERKAAHVRILTARLDVAHAALLLSEKDDPLRHPGVHTKTNLIEY